MITALVAHDPNRVIGNKGTMPWHIPEDLKLFKERTKNHCIIMGRKTWESLPVRPMPWRSCIVLSQGTYRDPLAHFWTNEAVTAVSFAKKQYPEKDIFVIGGAEIYNLFLEKDLIERIIISKIKAEYEGDTYFPELGKEWEVWAEEPNDLFDVVEYIKFEDKKLYEILKH